MMVAMLGGKSTPRVVGGQKLIRLRLADFAHLIHLRRVALIRMDVCPPPTPSARVKLSKKEGAAYPFSGLKVGSVVDPRPVSRR